MEMEKIYYTVNEAANILRYKPLAIKKKVASGVIPHKRLGKKILIPGKFLFSLTPLNPCEREGKNE